MCVGVFQFISASSNSCAPLYPHQLNISSLLAHGMRVPEDAQVDPIDGVAVDAL